MHFAVLRICQAAIVKTYIIILGLSACQKMLVFIPAASVKAILKSRVNARVLPGDMCKRSTYRKFCHYLLTLVSWSTKHFTIKQHCSIALNDCSRRKTLDFF